MILNLILFGLAVLLLATVIRGAPFLPTKPAAVTRMVELAKVRPGQKSVDIGSGDGRIVIAMAKAGAMAYGYEINPFLVLWSRYKINKAGLKGRAFVYLGSFWGKDFREFDIVTLFGIGRIMGELEKKLQNELRPQSVVLSYVFHFPNWKPELHENALYVYSKQ